jgi:quinol monooxygenase YgiN
MINQPGGASMSIPTDDNRDLLTVVAVMRAKAGKAEELQAALESLIEPTRAEDGCHTYALHRGTEDPAVFIFYENWTSAGHLDVHLATPHLQGLLPRIPELLDGELVINRLKRVA